MKVDFYHLTLSPVDRVLPRIAEKVLQSGARLLIVAGDAARRDALDKMLWSYAPESFLPHMPAGGGDDTRQPILIGEHAEAANGATHIAIADGVWREEALAFERAFHFFDSDTISAARESWKALATHEGVERRYWRQSDSGGWEQAA